MGSREEAAGVRLMESFCGDTEGGTEDVSVYKKSKIKSLKPRVFKRSNAVGGERDAKLSQSASDIAAGLALGSDEDLTFSQVTMGSRALSHESIFLDDQVLTDSEPTKVSSQENVSKIKALQMKLQQQKFHLAPPPVIKPIPRPEILGMPILRPEILGMPIPRPEILGMPIPRPEIVEIPNSRPEIVGMMIPRPEIVGNRSRDGFSHSLPDRTGDVSFQEVLAKVLSQPVSQTLSPIPKLVPAKSLPSAPSHPFPCPVPSLFSSSSSAVEAPLDFSAPAQVTTYLDTSAARHRMSIKPRNQRASSRRKPAVAESSSHLDMPNNIDHPEPVKKEQYLAAQESETMKTEQEELSIPITSQGFPSKSAMLAPVMPEASPKASSTGFSQDDQALPDTAASRVLRSKPLRCVDLKASEQPHSSFMESGMKEKREEDLEKPVISWEKGNVLHKVVKDEVSPDPPSPTLGSVVALRSSSLRRQVKGEGESTTELKRSTQGSGSFHFSITHSKNRDVEGPLLGSFAEMLEQIAARRKEFGGVEEKNLKEKEELRGQQMLPLAKVVPTSKSSPIPWNKRDSLKKVEADTPPKDLATDAGAVEAEEMASSQEEVEEAVEAKEVQEDEGKPAFGVKLRSTSQSFRLRMDDTASKKAQSGDQFDKQKGQEIGDEGSNTKNETEDVSTPPVISGEPGPTDPTPITCNASSTDDPHLTSKKVHMTSENPKEAETVSKQPQPAPQRTSSEVSWMALAMEKTRSLQQLFTSKFPRDLTGSVQTNAQSTRRPQAQVQQTETTTGTQTQTLAVRMQQCAAQWQCANQPETVQSTSTSQAPTLVNVTPKASPAHSNASKETQPSKKTEDHTKPNVTQSVSHPASHLVTETITRTTKSPSPSSLQAQSISQVAQGSSTQSLAQSYLSSNRQDPSRTNRGLKPTTSAQIPVSAASSDTVPPSGSAQGKGEGDATAQKDNLPFSTRRAIRTGSVSEKAAFLEKRAEWTTPPVPKGVELRKAQTAQTAQTETPLSGESPASVKTMPASKDTETEGKQGLKFGESSPTRVLERPQKYAGPSSLPSSSPTLSDNGQPSWMELAKRKSRAWSDKSMD
ncbi:uncharacterized protein cracdla [Pholidichthys leucotaenia]